MISSINPIEKINWVTVASCPLSAASVFVIDTYLFFESEISPNIHA
jgi:hypothetical protein